MEQWMIEDGNTSKYNVEEQELFLYQRMRATSNGIHHLSDHLELLKHLAAKLLLQVTLPTTSEIATACSTLLHRGGYNPRAVHIIELRLYTTGKYNLRVVETSLYKEFTLRVMRPKAILFDSHNSLLTLPTSAESTTNTLMRLYAYQYGGNIAICVDREGKILSVDGANPVITHGTNIVASNSIPSIYNTQLIERLKKLNNYTLTLRHISTSELSTADELFYADHRGITAVGELQGHYFSDSIAYAAANS